MQGRVLLLEKQPLYILYLENLNHWECALASFKMEYKSFLYHFFPLIHCWSLADEGHLVLFQYRWIIDKLISNVKYGFVCHLND